MYCKNCGAQMEEIQAICVKCGVKKGVGNKFCAHCGEPIDENAEVCLKCGVAVKKNIFSSSGGSLNGYSKTTIALVCFFLGGIGIHNFMLGENRKGLVKILLSLIFGLGILLALYEFVLILTDKYVIEPDKYV